MNIPFLSFGAMHGAIRSEMVAAFERVYDSHWYILGKSVARFEEAYAKFTGTEHCVGVSNGLDALYLSLKALGVGAGDEVIVPSNGYIATWLSVTFTGATPVPVEPDNRTFNLDPTRIAAAVSPRTRAIIPIHLYGQACDMAGIMAVAEAKGLKVIEDNAQAIGATYRSPDGTARKTGTIGTIGTTSFFPSKNLGGYGDGGAIFTQDAALAEKLQMIANHGQRVRYYHERVGCNSRLDTLQAAILLIKLRELDGYIAARQALAAAYNAAFAGIGGVRTPVTAPYSTHVFHQYTLKLQGIDRDGLNRYLAEHGVPSMIYYPVPGHRQKMFSAYSSESTHLPVTDTLTGQVISLPMHTEMQEDQRKHIIDQVAAYIMK